MVFELGIAFLVGTVFMIVPDEVFVKTEQEKFHHQSYKTLATRLFGP